VLRALGQAGEGRADRRDLRRIVLGEHRVGLGVGCHVLRVHLVSPCRMQGNPGVLLSSWLLKSHLAMAHKACFDLLSKQ